MKYEVMIRMTVLSALTHTHTACPLVSGQDKACQRQGDDLHFSLS